MLSPGTILRSTSLMDDENFTDTIILITEYNSRGAIGFVVNKPFDRHLNDLVEFRHARPFPLYAGGPVEPEKLFMIHQRPDCIHGGVLINDHLYLGGDMQQAIRAINNKTISTSDIKIFVGYCGWDAGDLEAEMEEGNWDVISAATIF